jgi:UDP-N-acetylglucosamine--N-acetylmuramyl-(pentapeptide) pyrophosphoryl-undecaprenol N-acetylglucosamine transferase
MKKLKFIFAGGGTGGHLFPAIAIAEEIKLLEPDSDILFIGNKDRIEGRVVPQYGFNFRNIRISGISRKMNLSNLLFPFKLLISVLKSIGFILKFKPDVVIGTGGYVSGPVLWSASFLGHKTVLQDHNSYPGITTRLLSSKAKQAHLAFEEAKKYFKKQDNLFLTGFPIRRSFEKIDKLEALNNFGFKADKKTIFITGGSQGAKNINDSILHIIRELNDFGIQVIWQTGSLQYNEIKKECEKYPNVVVFEFIKDMNKAFSACDFAVTRAGATTIGELMNMEVPAILIPLPTAAEDHQTKNAKALCDKKAGVLIPENELKEKLKNEIYDLTNDDRKLNEIKESLQKLQIKDSAKLIAQSIINLAKNNN